ncbi:hypothetical protein SRRS_07530 [Sporomusa rhizae]|uniref:hypothetical protein n=1 Tax=Sporomusa rhizae TaxID=357999 RepID=UPI00352A5CF5
MKNILPIPTHLKHILIPKGENDEFEITGDIRCDCGNDEFTINFIGDYQNGIVTLCEYEGVFYLVIKCKCQKCGKLHLIFDSNLHGWDGFVCSDESGLIGSDSFPVEEKLWSCPQCTNDSHKVSVAISSQGQADFIAEVLENSEDTRFVEDDWVNAFEWITISLKCLRCGFEDKKWIDYETM